MEGRAWPPLQYKSANEVYSQSFIEIITIPTSSRHMFFIKPYMTNAIFTNKNLMMFSDHI